ncbi:hypothetical protein CKAH01_12673 [Colletotrichum kahawae]|uniref:Uncharacterized protein n=1 Tax=Colletotrichum kahawae TaxID=34407 RepID=A0AAD9YQQ3_COLKA|nr:hypothetical protein CKAH01_12673 [Colletotrichum kahawae]
MGHSRSPPIRARSSISYFCLVSHALHLGECHKDTGRNKTVSFTGQCSTARGPHGVSHGYRAVSHLTLHRLKHQRPLDTFWLGGFYHDGICRVTRADQTSRSSPRLDEDETWRELCIGC